MKVIVMGCGRVGEQVSRLMASEGHEVVVIDMDAAALARLGPDFKGQTLRGVGFDREVLLKAGIEAADAFAATSASDNANIVAARIARNVFHVPRVVARLSDPHQAEIYQRLGMVTISSTHLGAQRIRELLVHAEMDPLLTFGEGEVRLLNIETPPRLVGQPVRHLNISGEITVIAITRQGRAFIPLSGSDLRAGDLIHLTVLAESMDRLKEMIEVG